jgi:predicted transcriptional regulator
MEHGLKMLTVRVGNEVFDRLDQLCEASDPKTTRSEMIRRALSVGLAALEQRDRNATFGRRSHD